VVDDVIRQESRYYSIALPTPIPNNPLTITVTPVTLSDPDLYCGFQPYPQAGQANVSSATQYREDSLVYQSADLAGHTTLYCTVFAFVGGRYSIVAHFDEPVVLIDGFPQTGALTTAPLFYRFTVPTTSYAQVSSLTIVATPLAGITNLLVNKGVNPDPAHTLWPAARNGAPLRITKDDPNWPASGVALWIGVYPLSNPCNFSLTVTTDIVNLELQNGVAVQRTSPAGQTNYFLVNVSLPRCNLTVTVTPQYGDPDLFISRQIPHPDRANHEFESMWDGEDSLRFSPADPVVYYIGVEAWSASAYSVTAYLECATIKSWYTIVNGYPQTGSLERGEYQYFIFYAGNAHDDLSITVSRTYGDPDLYVSLTSDVATDKSTWSALAWGSDQLTISAHDTKGCINCFYYIAVYASTRCAYTLSVTSSDEITTLRNGVPITENLDPDEFEYFRFVVGNVASDSAFTIMLTDLAQGDPDLFVSTQYERPNRTHHDWIAERYRSDAITISASDDHFCQNCVYYISVHALTATNFTLVATFENNTRLVDGMPQYGGAVAEQFRYYEFILPGDDNSDITFTLSVQAGFAQLFVSAVQPPNHDNQYAPTTWRSAWWNSAQNIRIFETDPLRCNSTSNADGICRYYVGVHGVTVANFTVVAYTNKTNIRLQNGLAQQAHVEAGEVAYFSFDLRIPNADLAIAVTPTQGDPDLWIAVPGKPNYNDHPHNASTAYAWNVDYGASIVDIDNTTTGLYYIGVEGYQNSTFTIMVLATDPQQSDTSSTIQLIDGQPQLASAHKGHYRYFQIDIEGLGVKSIDFSISAVFGDPDLYVTDDPNSFPNADNSSSYKWSSTAFGSDKLTLIQSDVHSGTYTIGVRGYATSGFYITVASDRTTQTLTDGQPVHSSLAMNGQDYFAFPVSDFSKDITFGVTALTGDPDIFIGLTDRPNATTAIWSGQSHLAGDFVVISKNHPSYCRRSFPQCVYYVTVIADQDACEYVLTASTSNETVLADGIPTYDTVTLGNMKYFSLSVPRDTHKDLTISLSVSAGLPQLYVTAGNSLPSPTSYTWASDYWFTGAPLVIRHNEATACQNLACTFHIGVFGFADCNFTITASSNIASTHLVEGIPLTTASPTGEFEYFFFRNYVPNREIDVIVTALSGDPDVYVSTIYQDPGPGRSEYSSTAWGSDLIVLDPANSTAPYYIGVKSFINATFTILIQGTSSNSRLVQLNDGQPIKGVVKAGHFRYYQWFLNPGQTYEELSISVNRQIGDPDIYLNQGTNLPTTTSYWRRAIAAGGDLLTIQNPTAGYYTLGIYGSSTATDSAYTVTMSTSAVAVRLREGVAVREDLFPNTFEYFVFGPVINNGMDLTFSLTAFVGDPDIYVSSKFQKPNLTNCDYLARSYGNDSITIASDYLAVGKEYYIGVHAFQANASFSIIATYGNSSLISLQDGVPQSGRVAKGSSAYYTFHSNGLNATDDIVFTLTPYSGSGFLYLSRLHKPQYGNHSSYEWFSTGGASQTIVVHSNDAQFTTGPSFSDSTTWSIMVYGRADCEFTITAASSQTNIPSYLIDGWPSQQVVTAGEYAYFMFDVYDSTANISISVTPINGNPNIYVATNTTHPAKDAGDFTWKSDLFGADAVNIYPNDGNFVVGTYYIAVYAAPGWFGGNNATFFITASSSYKNFILSDGQPQFHMMDVQRGRSRYDYYRFWVGSGHRNVSISVTARAGQDPDLYVRNDGQWPVDGFSQWNATHYGRDDIVIPDACSNCMFIIAVRAFTLPCAYTLVATSSSFPTELVNGAIQRDRVAWGDYTRYFVRVPEGTPGLFISVTVSSGDPDLYVAGPGFRTDTPTYDNYEYKAFAWGSDYLYIPHPRPGTYNVGVYGSWDSTYTITATTDVLQLEDGYAQDDVVEAASTRYFEFVLDALGTPYNLTLSLNVHTGYADFYMTNDGSIPSPTNSQFSSTTPSAIRGVLNIPASQVNPGIYRVAVVGSSTQSSFTIGFVYANTPLLVVGKPLTASVEMNQWAYYRYIVDPNDNEIDISVNNLGGRVELYAKMFDKPSNTDGSYDWHSLDLSPMMVIQKTSIPPLQGGMLYIGIFGREPSVFSISVTSRTTQLSLGVPVAALSKASGNFFYFLSLQQQSDLMVEIDFPPNTDPAISANVYLSVNESHSEPSVDNSADWTVTLTPSHNSFTIGKNDPHFCAEADCQSGNNGCQCSAVFVGVFFKTSDPTHPATDISFTIGASTDKVLNTLSTSADVQSSFVTQGGFKYFQLLAPSNGDYYVVAEPCGGQVALYASEKYTPSSTPICPSPGCQRNKADDPNSMNFFQLSLSATDPQSPKFIAVGFIADDPDAPGQAAQFQLHTRPRADMQKSVNVISPEITFGDAGDGSAEGTAVAISFQPAQAREPSSTIVYTIYYATPNQNAVMFSPCGMRDHATPKKVYATGAGAVTQVIKDLSPGVTYVFNVVAQYDNNQFNHLPAVYSPKSITMPDNGGGGGLPIKLVLGIGIPVVLLAIGALVYLILRNRKLSKELKIEMHDVPKAAVRKAMVGPTGSDHTEDLKANKQSKTYSRLLSTGDEDDEPQEESGYTAPDL